MSGVEVERVPGTVVRIQPDETYVVEVDIPIPTAELERMRDHLQERTGATFIVLGPGIRLARESAAS